MGKTNFNSAVGCTKIVGLVLGAIVLGQGLWSHYTSTWTARMADNSELRWYNACDLKEEPPFNFIDKPCPPILYEEIYIYAIIASFALSLLFFIAGCVLLNFNASPIKYIDAIYHAIFGLLLAAASCLYIMSTMQIDAFFDFQDSDGEKLEMPKGVHFRTWEKMGAALLTLLLALEHGIVAALIIRC